MVNLLKTIDAPPCLAIEKAKANGDYKCGGVLSLLKSDFHNKCYICEAKGITSINVEHFIPHQGDNDLKFDWFNLFFACSRCNNIKRTKVDLLNCINPNHDVELWIKYEFKSTPETHIVLTALEENNLVHNTIQLLNDVYNGTTTLKIIEADNLRTVMEKNIMKFRRWINVYRKTENGSEDKEYALSEIKQHLKKSSAFTAFKRQIIKDNQVLFSIFSQYID